MAMADLQHILYGKTRLREILNCSAHRMKKAQVLSFIRKESKDHG